MSKKEATPADAPKEDSGPEVGTMKNGDYCVHVYIQSGKQIKAEKSDTSTPMIGITVNGKTKYTSAKNDVSKASTVQWGEHLFFDMNNVSKAEIESCQVQLRVLNKGMFKDELIGISFIIKLQIGTYEFDVTYIYFQEKHTLFNTWIALSNPEGKDFNEITCYLKLAISITGPGDDQVAINDQTGSQGNDEEVMMPPSIKKVYKQLKIRFVKGEKFPKMDIGGTIDAYIKTQYLKKKIKTTAVTQTKQTSEAFLEQEFWLPIQWPLASDRLVLKVYDKDMVKDEIVGSMYFSLKQLIGDSGENGYLKWYNLYGSPLGCSGDNTKKMNKFPEFASTWKGRILMHVSCVDTKNPEMKVQKLEPEFKDMLIQTKAMDLQEFEIICEVGAGISLPAKKKYQIKVQINDQIFKTTRVLDQKGNYNRWNERFAVTVYKCPYKSVQELGRVYVYLMDGDDPICFWKGEAYEFMEPNAAWRWLPMTCDLALGKCKNAWEAGLIQFKMSINHKTKNGPVDFQRYSAWKKPPPKRLGSYKIRCFIFQCRDIPSADADGSSDPYISIWNPDDKKVQTKCIEDNINPIFFEGQEIYYEFDALHNAPPIVLNIWDKDNILDGDDYLGRSVVYLTEANVSHDDTIPKPKWHDIRIGFNPSDPACGGMLCSFSVVEDDYNYKIPMDYLRLTDEISYKEFNVDLNILGLRSLQSIGVMPVKKPFIKFNLRSLLPPEKAQAVTNIKTNPAGSGSNPNINTVINFQIELPEDPLFCPKLACDVYDMVFKGFMQPLMGTFSIAIGELMHQQREDRDQQLIQSDEIIYFLKKSVKEFDKQYILQQQQLQGSIAVGSSNLETTAQKQVSFFNQQPSVIQPGSFINQGPDLEFEESKIESENELKIHEDSHSNQSSLSIESGFKEISIEGMQNQLRFTARRQALPAGNFFKKENELMQEIEDGVNTKFQVEKIKMKKEEKQKMKGMRMEDIKKMKEEGGPAYKNILYPKYELDTRLNVKREIEPKPPLTIYKEVGYDQDPPEDVTTGNKHYRKFFEDELENVKEIFPKKAFHQCDIIRGQSRGLNKGFFSMFSKKKDDDSGQVSNQKIVGYFKGRINIENEDEKKEYRIAKETKMRLILQLLEELHYKKLSKPFDFKLSDLESFEKQQEFQQLLETLELSSLGILPFLKEQSYQEMISRMLIVKTKCIVRLYMIEGYEFVQKDLTSPSDPYLKLKCGKKKYNEREFYQLDQPNPKFHKMFEFDVEFPGAPPLEIKAYDYDDLFGDDMIGKTIIDLDDRFFSPEWQQIEEKPIEYRSLYHPSSQIPQGTVVCWCEIHPTTEPKEKQDKIYDISPQPELEYQVRLVVYDTQDTPAMDAEGTSDVFIKAHIDDNDKGETDTHFRCSDGSASFNYRILFDLKAPRTNTTLTIQTWDRDLFCSNDFIGEIQLPLKYMFEDAILSQKTIDFNKKYWNSYLQEQFKKQNPDLLKRFKIRFQTDDSFLIMTYGADGKPAGTIRLGLSIVPGVMAKANAVGKGRSEPNHSPYLSPPVGRISFSLNPFAMLGQFVGPAVRRKIYCACCCIICMALCVVCIPFVFSSLVSNMILAIF